jgi:hypothetical protein
MHCPLFNRQREPAATRRRTPNQENGPPRPRRRPPSPNPPCPRWLTSRENAARAVFLLGALVPYLMVEILNNNDPFQEPHRRTGGAESGVVLSHFWVLRMLIGRKGVCLRVSSGFCALPSGCSTTTCSPFGAAPSSPATC